MLILTGPLTALGGARMGRPGQEGPLEVHLVLALERSHLQDLELQDILADPLAHRVHVEIRTQADACEHEGGSGPCRPSCLDLWVDKLPDALVEVANESAAGDL